MSMNTITNFDAQAVVIDAGVFPTAPEALRWLESCRRTVCCDGAANDFIAAGHKPWRIVGDCDSLSPKIMERYGAIVTRVSEQESNDQTKAVRFLASEGVRRVVILGATGKREDHTLGNISLLVNYLHHGVDARIYTDCGVFIPVADSIVCHCPTGTQVSIFNFGATGLRAQGLRYPLRDFDSWWQGTLNESVAPVFRVDANGYFLLYLAY